MEHATGIVLRTRLLSETSLIVHWLTEEAGRLSTIAKGARRAKSPFRGKIDLFFLAQFSYKRSRRSDLHLLNELTLQVSRPRLPGTVGHLQQAAYGALLIEQTTETETPIPAVFNLFQEFLRYLATHTPQAESLFAFEIKLLQELGYQPDWTNSPLEPACRQIAEAMQSNNWKTLPSLQVSPEQSTALNRFLKDQLSNDFGRLPDRREAALAATIPWPSEVGSQRPEA